MSNLSDVPAFKTANEFSLHIEKQAAQSRMSHLDAVLEFCKKHFVEPDEIASKINKSLREKLERDFQDLNYLPKKAEIDV